MDFRERTPLIAIVIIAIIVISAIGLGNLDWSDDDDTNSIKVTDDPKVIQDLMDTLLSSESTRSTAAVYDPVVVDDDPFLVLASTPRATWYEGTTLHQYPLIVDSGSSVETGDRFLNLYPNEGATRIGNVEEFDWTFSTSLLGTQEEISINIANTYWTQSDGAIIMGTSSNSYHQSLSGIVLASYLNIPVILEDEWTGSEIKNTLTDLGVKYTLIFDDSEGFGTTYRFTTQDSIEDIVIRFLDDRFGGVSYITLTNPMDLDLNYALPGISSLAPYLTASRQGVISAAIEQPLPPDRAFREEPDAFLANVTTYRVKDKLTRTQGIMDNLSALQPYLDNSPYLAILGSAYSLPFYYTYLVPKGIMADSSMTNDDSRLINDASSLPTGDPYLITGASSLPTGDPRLITDDQRLTDPRSTAPAPPYQNINEPALVPSDDIYADIDGDYSTAELAMGRPIGINLEDASTLITRTFFYDEYMAEWNAESPVSQMPVVGTEWKNTAYIHFGDDWNGYVTISSPAAAQIYEYLTVNGYHTYTTPATGATVDSITRFFQSSNMVFILAHGSESGFHMLDGYSADMVKNWFMGPSSWVVTSCNVGNTDCPNLTDIDDSMAFAILRTGINAFFGGMRYEYTGVYNPDDEYGLVTSGSPRLSQLIIAHLSGQDLTTGMALRDSKNQYMSELANDEGRDYDIAIKMLYGDPMFNPYEP